jgi:hypothetical protein
MEGVGKKEGSEKRENPNFMNSCHAGDYSSPYSFLILET